jgi:glutamyl-Q tRNA(Asp) synthetase
MFNAMGIKLLGTMTLVKAVQMNYIGRFAPSPSGPLHFGSLVTAVASYLQARYKKGQWLVRIEDIDPPREMPNAADSILKTLLAHGLHWDGDVSYQSQHSDYYESTLSELKALGLTYYCECTRQQIKARGGHYDGFCRDRQLGKQGTSTRLCNQSPQTHYNDVIQGAVSFDDVSADEDFVIKRKDQLYAYQLAVVADDARQGVTEVIRGCDLLPATFHQLCLFSALDIKPPLYGHVPVVASSAGMKLSKQNKAPAIDNKMASENLYQALVFLGLKPELTLKNESVDDILIWAVAHWDLAVIPLKKEIIWQNKGHIS